MLQHFQNGTNSFLQIDFVLDGLFAELTMLEFVPELLIRIQFWRMGWKKEQPNLGAVCADKFTDCRRVVKGGLIGNDNQGTGTTVQNLLKKLYLPFSINRLGFQRVMPFTRRGDDRQHIITTPAITDRHRRRLSHFPPGTTRPRHHPSTGLLLKGDIGPQLRG